MGTKVLEPAQEKPKKDMPPVEKRERNDMGDFVVTKIVIPDLKPKVVEQEEQSEDDDESEDEPEQPKEESKEVEKPKEKKLSKK